MLTECSLLFVMRSAGPIDLQKADGVGQIGSPTGEEDASGIGEPSLSTLEATAGKEDR